MQSAILDLDKSLTVGEAFERNRYFENINWQVTEEGGRTVVAVTGTFDLGRIAVDFSSAAESHMQRKSSQPLELPSEVLTDMKGSQHRFNFVLNRDATITYRDTQIAFPESKSQGFITLEAPTLGKDRLLKNIYDNTFPMVVLWGMGMESPPNAPTQQVSAPRQEEDPEPIKEAKRWLETKFRFSPAANAWYGKDAQRNEVIEVPKFTVSVLREGNLSEADRLNGRQWNGEIKVLASAYRVYDSGEGWSQWESTKGNNIVSTDKWIVLARKQSDVWSIELDTASWQLTNVVPLSEAEEKTLPEP